MDFTEDPDRKLIRAAVREICARFPDEYWAGLEESHTFPTAAAVLGRDGDADPAALGHRVVEVPGEALLGIAPPPLGGVEVRAKTTHRLAHRLLLVGEGEVHKSPSLEG